MKESTNKEIERLLPTASLGYSVYMTPETFMDLLTSAKAWDEAVKAKTKVANQKVSDQVRSTYVKKDL